MKFEGLILKKYYLQSRVAVCSLILFFVLFPRNIYAQLESATAQMKVNRIWTGVTANADNGGSNSWTAGFFPNDYDIFAYRGQTNELISGSGFQMACTSWTAPIKSVVDITKDSVYTAAVFGPKNEFQANGKVLSALTSYMKYPITKQVVNNKPTDVAGFTYATVDPSKFINGTFDQIVEATTLNVIGMSCKRKILGWSQNYNDNYIIVDVELTNIGVPRKVNGVDTFVPDTLRNFYLNMNQGANNIQYSNGNSPSISTTSSDYPKYSYIWQHYYGARPADSMRIFYYYSADDPSTAGDNMGGPVSSQRGRLIYSNFNFYSILHATKIPYINSTDDVDDPLQPKVTYIGTATRIPDPSTGEQTFGSKNFWAISGGFAGDNLTSGGIPGTFHMLNNDDINKDRCDAFPAGTLSAVDSRNFSSFGPYTVPPGYKLHFVYAVGMAGIGLKTSKEVGEQWLRQTITDPPNMPNSNTGWLPAEFQFPSGANLYDMRKDRWISMGRDSMFLSAWRAKWNFEHNYSIPQAPAPPDSLIITSFGDGMELKWSDAQAEALPNFAGYRIMRRISNLDSVAYEEIYSSGESDKVVAPATMHVYKDVTTSAGAQTYYYIQAKAVIDNRDPNYYNADPTTRGKILFSGRTFVPNVAYVNPPRRSTDEMSKIRIVPNPYNVNDPSLLALGSTDTRNITFYNLPVTCTIKIFTENGDLVATLGHPEGTSTEISGSRTWDMITSSQQVISSGVYIAVIQKPNGQTAYQKFVVVR